MSFLLDTNIVIHARDGDEAVLARRERHIGAAAMSAISFAELQRGIFKRPDIGELGLGRLRVIQKSLPVLAFDAPAAEAYGQIIRQCGWAKGRDFDRMIAAHAISVDATLVTNNAAAFRDIPGLRLEDWVEEPL